MRYLYRDWLEVTGADALRFLQGMWTCDFKRAAQAAPAGGRGFLLTGKGKLVSQATFLTEGPEKFLLSLPGGLGEKTRDALDHYLIADDVELKLVDGPFAHVGETFGARSNLVSGPPTGKDIVVRANIAPDRVELAPFEVWLRNEEVGMPKVKAPSGELAARRVRDGIPEWGVDYSADSFPLEFPFSDRISFFKGCYIGQETVARATFRGHVTRAFCRVQATGPLSTDFVYLDSEPDRPVGKLTTVSESAGLGLLRLHAFEKVSELHQKNGTRIVAVESLIGEDTYKSL